MRFIALDFETGGLVSSVHAPVSLGVALMEDLEVIDTREWLIAPTYDRFGKLMRQYDPKAMQVNGYTVEQLQKDGIHIAQVRSELATWAGDLKVRTEQVVAFNAPFDYAFYSEALFLAGKWHSEHNSFHVAKPPLVGPWHCARMIASVRLDLPNYKLDTVAAHFGLKRTQEFHGALEDCILAGKVFTELKKIKKEQAA